MNDLPGRIMSLDYGTKRTGIAVTDPLRLIATGLDTVDTHKLFPYLEAYFSKEKVSLLIIGLPLHADGTATKLEDDIRGFIRKIQKIFPDLTVDRIDESFSSAKAKQIILQSGASRKKRQDKSLLDKVSASLILQEYMDYHMWQDPSEI